MFRSSTILRELVKSLAKVTLLLKHSVKLRKRHAATSPHNTRRRNFTESFNSSVTYSQALYKLPEDGRRPKHEGAIIMCIFM